MTSSSSTALASILQKNAPDLLEGWVRQQLSAPTLRSDLLSEADLRDQSREFLARLSQGARAGGASNVDDQAWEPARQLLATISESRSMAGFSPAETATFVLSLKRPLLEQLRGSSKDPAQLADDMWQATMLLDGLALHTMEVYVQTRERLIARQQEDMLELSTPVVKLWDGILALPMIGTLDSARTQVVMEALLQRIVETGAEVAIIDITGVPTVDTLVAQHLIKTVTAARLMGADCIISGIRPQIAATIVHLGVDLSEVATKATLADAFRLALKRTGHSLGRQAAVKG